jgi:hypothetical protein
MQLGLVIFILTLIVYIPLAAMLLYVWWKYGKHEPVVSLARTVFLLGSFALFLYMIII